MKAYTEQELVNGCRRNDRRYQEAVYRQYYSSFLKVCARYAQNMADAEQLLQDAMLTIFSKINTYGNIGSFAGWMRRIVVNTCLDYLRSRYLKQAGLTESIDDIQEGTFSDSTEDALGQLRFADLLKMIQSVPPVSRTVFNLFVFEGFTHKEIAATLEISEGTSYWHLNNARKLLQAAVLKDEQQHNITASYASRKL